MTVAVINPERGVVQSMNTDLLLSVFRFNWS